MIKKTIKFTDFEGAERQIEALFNLTRSECMELQMSADGGLEKMLTRIVEENDVAKIVEWFKKIILKSYGKRSDDGMRFVKSEELATEFSQTMAYDELFMALSQDADAAAEFINGIIPQNM